MLEQIIITIATAATPLLIAAIGELVVERSGVLNLGVEGMMVMGAVTGFAVAFTTGSPWLGLIAAIVVGALFSLLFGFLSLTLVTNQVATGLALTLLGLGVSGMLGESFTGLPGVKLPTLYIPFLSDLPFVGKLIFGQDPVFYLSMVYTPQWIENMTAGRGWIALALVVFASWRPWRVLAGAYLFGAVSIGQLHAQALGMGVPSQLLSSLPYLATVLVLVLISRNRRLTMVNTPASLGRPFVPDR
jgi:general nucleoside transport system permease protein